MSVLNENQLLGASGAGGDYEIEQSLRFDDGRGSSLTRTPASASNRKTFTISFWMKRGVGGFENVIRAYSAGNDYDAIQFTSGNQIRYFGHEDGTNVTCTTNALYRDSSSWYHFLISVDTTQSTSSNRIKIYANGVLQTLSTATYPSQNEDLRFNSAVEHEFSEGSLDAYLAEFNFIDGQALTPDSFGETGDYGEWLPSRYAGTYGTNGFYLPFEQDYSVEGFSTVTYEGTSTSQYIGGTGFSPDMSWFKVRSTAGNHQLYDTVRGASSRLVPNATTAESTTSNGFAGWQADGFSLDGGGGGGDANTNGRQYVAWNWDMGSTTASNTSGTINSSVRANQAYGQSIVTYTGTGSNATVGHGLSSAPQVVILKNREDGSKNWNSQFTVLGNNYIDLNRTNASYTGATYFQNTAPSSTVFSVGTAGSSNASSNDFVAYCFHSVTGYSKFGSYTGNNSTSNVITTGFTPAFVMIKNTESAYRWYMLDNTRDPNNPAYHRLFANNNDSESSNSNILEFTSTGFKIITTDAEVNQSGKTMIYMAFADTREYAYWYDQSGNNNDWTSEGGLTESDVMVDSPTNNFAVMNPLDNGGNTLSEGNLALNVSSGFKLTRSTFFADSGKWYWEILCTDAGNGFVGVSTAAESLTSRGSETNSSVNIATSDGDSRTGASTSSYGSSFADGDIMILALDMDNGKFYAGKNGTWFNSGNPATSANPAKTGLTTALSPSISLYDNEDYNANFGADSSFAGNKTPQGNQDANGIGDFYYAPPTGFLALCTKSLPSVDVIPSENFNTVLYTGNGSSTHAITGVGFTPDWLWAKQRNTTRSHRLLDSVRGNGVYLASDNTNSDASASGLFKTFDSDGFTLDAASALNQSGGTYVSWNWKAGGATPSKTYTVTVVSDSGNKYRFDGFGTSAATLNLQEGGTYTFNYPAAHPFRFSTTANGTHGGGSEYTTGVTHVSSTQTKIVVAASAPALYYYCSVHSGMGGAVNTNATFGSSNFSGSTISTVSANVDAGFSIVSYTGTGSNATVGHGLSSAPEIVICKNRIDVSSWSFNGSAGGLVYGSNKLLLQTTDGFINDANEVTSANSTTFSVGTSGATNGASDAQIAYCFHSVESYSKVGSYTGNTSSTDGTFVHCGFAVSFLLIKDTGAGNTWVLLDSKRDSINPNDTLLQPQSSAAETTGWAGQVDFLSNGFKIRSNDNGLNAARTYIFYAIAENPFKHTNAR